jgi:hypothetical protein
MAHTENPHCTLLWGFYTRSRINNSSGYIFYLVLVVLALIGTLGYITLTNTGQTQVLAARELKKLQTSLLAESGLIKAEYFLNGGDVKGILWETKGMVDSIAGKGEICVKAARFGGFTKISSAGSRQGMTCFLSGIAGRELMEEMQPVITLFGGIPGLVIDENTAITGKVVLSGGYLARGKNKQPIKEAYKWVSVKKSQHLPFDITPIKSFIDTLSAGRISLLSYPKAFQGSLTIDKSNDTIITNHDSLVVVGNCIISEGKFFGKTIVCAGFMSIGDNVECSEASFLAESLEVKGGKSDLCLFYSDKNMKIGRGCHNSQFISTDTIFVGKDAKFEKLTVWMSFRTLKRDTLKTGGVVFAENGDYSGCCLSFQDSTQKEKRIADMPVVVLGKNSVFNGSIITDGNVEINNNNITGHVWAGLIKTTEENKMQYVNFLFKTKIKAPIREPPFLLVGGAPVRLNYYETKRNYSQK